MPSGGTPRELTEFIACVALPGWYEVKRRRQRREALRSAALQAGLDPEQAAPKPKPFGVVLAYTVGGLLVTAAVLALYGCTFE
jgi:hypothetical protein